MIVGMAATDEKIASCVAHYRRLLDVLPDAPTSLSQAPDSHLRVILDKAGAKRRTDAVLARLDEAFLAAGIVTHPRLTEPGLGREQRIFMLDGSAQIEGLAPDRCLFDDERTLHHFLMANSAVLDEFTSRGLVDFRSESPFTDGKRVDLLCRERDTNVVVGIELKAAQPDDRAVGQIEQYLDDLAKYAKDHGHPGSRAIVIAGQPDLSVKRRVERYAAAQGQQVEFLLYRVDVRLEPHPSE